MAAITLQILPYGGINGRTVSCIFAETVVSRQRGHTIRLNCADGDSLLPRRRSVVLSEFYYKCKDDVLITIDHDISWRPGDAVAIAERALENDAIVGGLYCKRAFGQGWGSRIGANKEPLKFNIPSNEVLDAIYVASGFMAIPRVVIRKMLEDPEKAMLKKCWDSKFEYWDFYHTMSIPHPTRPELMEYISEDWAFCERAKKFGVKCLIDLRPVLLHWGEHGYNVGDAIPCQQKAPNSTNSGK